MADFGKLYIELMQDPIAGANLCSLKTFAALTYKQQRENSYSPSERELMQVSKLTEKSVVRGLKILEETGWITVIRREGARNKYQINDTSTMDPQPSIERYNNGKPVTAAPASKKTTPPLGSANHPPNGKHNCKKLTSRWEAPTTPSTGSAPGTTTPPTGSITTPPTGGHIKSTRDPKTKTRDIQEKRPAHASEEQPSASRENQAAAAGHGSGTPWAGYCWGHLVTAHPLRSERFTPGQLGEFLDTVYRNNAASGVSNAAFDPYAETLALDRVPEAFPNASFEDIVRVSAVIRDGNLGKDGIKAFWMRNGSGAPWDCGARSMLVGKQRKRFQTGLEIAARANGAEGRTRFSDGTVLGPEAQARLDALNQQQSAPPRIDSWEALQEHLAGRLAAGSVGLVEKSFQGVSDGVFQFGPLSEHHKEILRAVCRISCNSDKAIH